MNETARRLWIELHSLTFPSERLPCSFDEIFRRIGIANDSEFSVPFAELRDLGAVEMLPLEEINEIAAGKRVPGALVELTARGTSTFLRVTVPSEIRLRLAATLVILRTVIVAAESAPKFDLEAIISATGITDEQLSAAKTHMLDDNEWSGMRSMPDEWFARAWQTHRALGRTKQMMDIVAALLRIAEHRAASIVENRVLLDLLERRLAFANSVVEVMSSKSDAHSNSKREPIPESVRHEVWRRDQGRCTMCGSQERLHFDHIIPWSKGGSNTTRNIQLLCEGCNLKKSDSI